MKHIRDRINALKSQLKELKQPKLGKSYFDNERIKTLESELNSLERMKIKNIEKIGTAIHVRLDNNEFATFYQFGNDIYSTVSDNINKKYFEEFKKTIIECDWDEKQLRKIWVEKE